MMENVTRFLQCCRRRFNPRFQLLGAGWLSEKVEWVDQVFASCNFSFILSGSGTCEHKGRRWRVEAPCVMVQWPGECAWYGPDEGTSWDEIYFIFPENCLRDFLKLGYFDEKRLFWRINDFRRMLPLIHDMRELIVKFEENELIDRLDMMSELLVMESLVGGTKQIGDDEEVVRGALERIRRNPVGAFDFDRFAEKHGMSSSTFRRRWMKIVGVPPGKFVISSVIDKACRLLVETDYSINEIAEKLDYSDPLYFSRRFKLETGISATRYRLEKRKILPIKKG